VFSQGYLTVTDSYTNEIVFEKGNKRYTLLQHSCKDLCPRCPGIGDLGFTEIEERQRWALSHYSFKVLCPVITDFVVAEVDVREPGHYIRTPTRLSDSLWSGWSNGIVKVGPRKEEGRGAKLVRYWISHSRAKEAVKEAVKEAGVAHKNTWNQQ
jgi:hypothetical protein